MPKPSISVSRKGKKPMNFAEAIPFDLYGVDSFWRVLPSGCTRLSYRAALRNKNSLSHI